MLALHGIIINLSKNLKNRIQASENKCICFCLQLDEVTHISKKQSETINWLPIKERYNQCVISIVFKYFDDQYPDYINEVFNTAPKSSLLLLRSRYQKTRETIRKTKTGQIVLSVIGPALWN